MVGMLSDKGNIRSLNEDFAKYIETSKFSIYVVADGMGGHNAGEVASKMAAEGIVEYILENFNETNKENILEEAINKVNLDIYNFSIKTKELQGMGTTVTACLSFDNKVIVANVGDSSSFAFDGNQLVKITKDHSLVQELVDLGSITEEQAAKHPKKNIITRAVGIGEVVKIDIFSVLKDNYNLFLLCSDGLTNDVSINDIVCTLKGEKNLQNICERLVHLAKSNAGRDNITVLLFGGDK